MRISSSWSTRAENTTTMTNAFEDMIDSWSFQSPLDATTSHEESRQITEQDLINENEISSPYKPPPSPRILVDLFHQGRWDDAIDLIEAYPSLTHMTVDLILQCETVQCTPLHAACSYKDTPLCVIDVLVTANTASVLQKASRGGRLAIHVAILKNATPSIVQYLARVCPESLCVADDDGNLPLHLAAMYAGPSPYSPHHQQSYLDLLLKESPPQAFQCANKIGRMPLHLLCAVNAWNVSIPFVPKVLQVYPQALQHADRNGRLPLHIACDSGQPWSVLECLLTTSNSSLLLQEDFHGKTPVDLALERHSNESVVYHSLRERAWQEQGGGFTRKVASWVRKQRRKKKAWDHLVQYSCYG